jgi:hypothetical protein
MDKKEIYEHLAKIYLDASSKRKKKDRKHPITFKKILWAGIPIAFIAAGFVIGPLQNKTPHDSQIVMVLQPETVKINFNFNPAKKEIYTLNLNKLNLARFTALSFAARKTGYFNKVNLKIELTSRFKEKSALYVRNIPYKWQDYKINLSDFKGIAMLSSVSGISFIVEEWNSKDKDGVTYLDNISLLK